MSLGKPKKKTNPRPARPSGRSRWSAKSRPAVGLAKGLLSLRRELYVVGLSSPLSLHLLFFLLLHVIFLLGAIFSLYVRCQPVSSGQKTSPFCTSRIEVILYEILLNS